MTNKTIYALSTVYGKSGVAIIRISGNKALNAIKQMTEIKTENIKPRYAYFSDVKDGNNLLDKALVLYFKSPNSFTGEDVVEFQVHGSKAVISSVLECLSRIDGFRLAEAGEFSKRAFYNQKMDLTEAEGLADLIDSETSEQQKYAIRQIEGSLKGLYEGWRKELLTIMAHLEAYIDFPDEDIPSDIVDNMQNTVFKVVEAIEKHLSSGNIGERLRDGFRVVILGEPNAGKSSLLNAIAKREAVIVSDIEGTTRDAIDIHLDINGYPVTFTDTAGLRKTTEKIEQKGIEIAYSKAKDADVVVCLFDALKNIPQGFENTMYSWLLNFQDANPTSTALYNESRKLEEGDVFIYSDPDCYTKDYPDGLALFDPDYNCACLLGMRYFGEHKKGTLTLGWSIAQRLNYTACHGGQKRFNLPDGSQKVISVFGLSGSGKSTITLSDHNGKMNTTVLHDDAFIISNTDGSSISLEPSYFDKTQDYPLTKDQSKYFLTVQNCGATVDADGKIVPVTEDILNGNGRTVKSKFAAMNREYKFDKSTDAIFWIMKDASLPPVVKVNDPALASAMGATLATKRSTAEYVPGEDPNKLVIVPYANPFRLYPLSKDYLSFKSLFENLNVDCYIINTGFFGEKKVTPAVTLGLIEDIVENKATFKQFGPFSGLQYYEIPGYEPNFEDASYRQEVKARMSDRLGFVSKIEEYNKLPEEAIEAIKKVVDEIN